MSKSAVLLSALLLSSSFLFACTPCNLIACGPSFVLDVAQQGGLSDGDYALALDIEGEHHELTCTVGAQMGAGACSPPFDDEGVFTVSASVGAIDGVPEIRVTVVDTSDTDGSFVAGRGPNAVDVSVDHLDMQVATATYAPQYTRVDDYRGDTECGYCDEMAQPQRLEIMAQP